MPEKESTKTFTPPAPPSDGAAIAVAEEKPRFAPSGITSPEYVGTRIRRWEVYQATAIRNGCKSGGYKSIDDIRVTDKNHPTLAQLLTTCLVQKPGTPVAHLFRPGVPGIKQVMDEVSREDLANALKVAATISEIFPDEM